MYFDKDVENCVIIFELFKEAIIQYNIVCRLYYISLFVVKILIECRIDLKGVLNFETKNNKYIIT